MPDYPPKAVYEALVNALVHRGYMTQGSKIRVDMYDDRLEIVSPDGKKIQEMLLRFFVLLSNPIERIRTLT